MVGQTFKSWNFPILRSACEVSGRSPKQSGMPQHDSPAAQPTNLSGKGRAWGVFTGQNRRNDCAPSTSVLPDLCGGFPVRTLPLTPEGDYPHGEQRGGAIAAAVTLTKKGSVNRRWAGWSA